MLQAAVKRYTKYIQTETYVTSIHTQGHVGVKEMLQAAVKHRYVGE